MVPVAQEEDEARVAQADPEALASYGRQIAEHIEFPGTTTVTPRFGLGDLPSGTRMCTL